MNSSRHAGLRPLRTSRSAPQTTRATLASSAGCTWTPPEVQPQVLGPDRAEPDRRDVPPGRQASGAIRTNPARTRRSAGHGHGAERAHRQPLADPERDEPDHGEDRLLGPGPNALPVSA